MKDSFFVEVVRFRDDKVVKRRGPMTKKNAEKVEAGMEINLNHHEYFIRIAPAG